jgi:VIT1/CCC1 family predicted Fe2+/Mn2+ transporter
LASGAAFIFGGIFPVLAALFVPLASMVVLQYLFAIIFLVILGGVAAKAGGSSVRKAIVRITFWGTVAMGVTAYIGHLFGVSVG